MVIVPVSSFSRFESSLAKVDLPLPLAPSSAMRSSWSRLGRLGAETVHERLHVLAGRFLLRAVLLLLHSLLGALPFELVVPAPPEGDFLLVKVDNRGDRTVQ